MRGRRQQRRRNNGTSAPHLFSSSTVVGQGRIVILPIIVLIIQSLFLTTPSSSRFFFLLLLSFRTTTTTTRAWTLGSRSSPCSCYWRRRLRPSVLLYQYNRRREQRSSGLLLFSGTSHSSSDDDDVNDAQSYSEQDFQRWERMYYKQEEELLQQRSSSVSSSASNKEKSDMVETETTSSTSSSPIRIVTLDLDNTLWDTTATIARANDVLAEFMNEQLLPSNKQLRVEKIMGKLWIRNKSRYAPIEQEQAKAPVLLTKLRKDAIRHVLQQQEHLDNDDDDSQQEKTKKKEGADDNETLVETAFQIWTQARHEAIPFHLAESALSCLQELRAVSSTSSPLLMGAITDGNSNPMSIPELAPYFDFCINAEMVGVGKPDKRVFLRAVQHVQQHYPEILMSSGKKAEQSSSDNQQLSEEWLEEAVGNWWVHIGDDFVKDIVAAKNLNMRSIWCRELVLDKTKKADGSNNKPNNDNDPSSSPKRTVEELVRKVSEMKVVEMQVGADRYLADSLQNEFADAITDEFRNVADIIQQWQQEAVRDDDSDNNSISSPVNGDTGADALTIDEEQSFFEVIHPDPKTSIVADDDDVVESSAAQAIDSTTKFCIHCGEKLPTVARFCSACGEKQ